MFPDSWQISGQTVLINSETEIGKDLKVNDPVLVNFTVLSDGSWLAKSIETTENEDEIQPPSTATIAEETGIAETLTPSATADTTMTSTPVTMGTIETTGTPAPGNRSGCNSSPQQPEAVRLAQQYNVTYQEIMGWFCQGFGFGEIKQAYDLSIQSELPASQVFAMRSSGLGWGQIKQQLAPKSTQTSGSGNNGNGNGNGHQNGKTKPTKAKGNQN